MSRLGAVLWRGGVSAAGFLQSLKSLISAQQTTRTFVQEARAGVLAEVVFLRSAHHAQLDAEQRQKLRFEQTCALSLVNSQQGTFRITTATAFDECSEKPWKIVLTSSCFGGFCDNN